MCFEFRLTEIIDNKAFYDRANCSVGAAGTSDEIQDLDDMALEGIIILVFVVWDGQWEEALVWSKKTLGGSRTIAAERSHLARADGVMQLLEAFLVCGVVLVEIEVLPFVLASTFFAWVV